jgi:PadR family transcriptional regulator PadR
VEAPVTARSALLQALVIPGYGRELVERIRRYSQGLCRLSAGSVYPALARLEREGLVRSDVVRSPGRTGRPRRFHQLTLRGVAARDKERSALAGLLRLEESRPPAEQPATIAERMRQCSDLSASLLRLRRRVVDAQGGR